jgi:acid phosphatase
VEDFHTNGGYDAEMTAVTSNAMMYAQALTPANNSVWVFDIDETSLSGYTEMLSIGFGYVSKLNHDWILNASAPALPQTQMLYNQLISQGFRIVFLTGRKDTEHDATVANLKNVGYNTFDQVIVRNPSQYNLTATDYKSGVRTELVEQQGYDVVGCIGDQWSDLHGPYTGFKVKLPNYMYFLP